MKRSWRDDYRKCNACRREYRPQRQAQSYCSPRCKHAAAYGRELTPEQEKLWPPVEEAIRARAETRYQRMAAVAKRHSQQGEVDPVALLNDRSDALGAKAAALKNAP